MELVVDANILIAALLKDNATRKILILNNHTYSIPEYLIDEIIKHLSELAEKSSMPKEVLTEILLEIIHAANIQIIPLTELNSYYDRAKRISPDIDDAYYFALALRNNCTIWSNDKKLKTQSQVRVLNTHEIIAYTNEKQ